MATPTLQITNAVSTHSDFTLLYVAKDGDLDDSATDNAEYEFNVRVWRNALLSSLTLDTSPATSGPQRRYGLCPRHRQQGRQEEVHHLEQRGHVQLLVRGVQQRQPGHRYRGRHGCRG